MLACRNGIYFLQLTLNVVFDLLFSLCTPRFGIKLKCSSDMECLPSVNILTNTLLDKNPSFKSLQIECQTINASAIISMYYEFSVLLITRYRRHMFDARVDSSNYGQRCPACWNPQTKHSRSKMSLAALANIVNTRCRHF